MATWIEDWSRPVPGYQRSNWQVQNCTFGILNRPSTYYGERLNYLTGKNVASAGGDKRISRQLPTRVVDLTGALSWEWTAAVGVGNNALDFWLFCNAASLDYSVAGVQGYFLEVSIGSTYIRTYRSDGGGAVTNFTGTYTWASADTSEHHYKVTRAPSGADWAWRVYLDGVLVLGPTNENTYTTGTHFGVGLDELDRVGPIIITS